MIKYHNLSQKLVKQKLAFNSNFGYSGCMASVVCFGPLLFKGISGDLIINAFVKLLKDERFYLSIFKSSGLCANVANKKFLIESMCSMFNITNLDFLKSIYVIELVDKHKKTHFCMLYDLSSDGKCHVYDPAFPFYIRDMRGFLKYYNDIDGKKFQRLREFPYEYNN